MKKLIINLLFAGAIQGSIMGGLNLFLKEHQGLGTFLIFLAFPIYSAWRNFDNK